MTVELATTGHMDGTGTLMYIVPSMYSFLARLCEERICMFKSVRMHLLGQGLIGMFSLIVEIDGCTVFHTDRGSPGILPLPPLNLVFPPSVHFIFPPT